MPLLAELRTIFASRLTTNLPLLTELARLFSRASFRRRRFRSHRRNAGRSAAYLFLDEGRTLADAVAQIGKLGTPNRSFALHFHLVHTGRMQRENPLHTFAIADAADGEHLVQPVTATADDKTSKNLYALFVAFNDFRMHPHGIADAEIRSVFAILFRFNFIK